jgi:hypothetical protein
MRRPLVLFTPFVLGAAALFSVCVLGVVACGGNDKPPLTPDGVEATPETSDSGTPGTPSTSTPTAAPPAK